MVMVMVFGQCTAAVVGFGDIAKYMVSAPENQSGTQLVSRTSCVPLFVHVIIACAAPGLIVGAIAGAIVGANGQQVEAAGIPQNVMTVQRRGLIPAVFTHRQTTT
jgi:hypothetical protein